MGVSDGINLPRDGWVAFTKPFAGLRGAFASSLSVEVSDSKLSDSCCCEKGRNPASL